MSRTKKATERKDVQMNVRIDMELAQKLETAVKGKDLTQAQVVRQALREFFERQQEAA